MMAQVWARRFYGSKQWRRCREYILRRDHYLCQCHKLLGGDPCGEPATDVHHIIELTSSNINDPSVSLDEDNLISINDLHHREWIHGKSNDCIGGFCFNEDGMLVQV